MKFHSTPFLLEFWVSLCITIKMMMKFKLVIKNNTLKDLICFKNPENTNGSIQTCQQRRSRYSFWKCERHH